MTKIFGLRIRNAGLVLAFSGLLLMSFSAFAQHTYYIAATGSDSNTSAQAQSKSTPWAHLPGMATCTGACASYRPVAGDKFILKGGDTWANVSFPITWTWSGSSGSPIYIGIDKTWFTGSSWNRAIFNAGGTPISGSYNQFVRGSGASYLTWDYIEMTGLNWQTSYAYASNGCGVFYTSNHITLSNLYVHGWSHTGGVTTDSFQCFVGTTGYDSMTGNLITLSVFDGSDSTNGGDSGEMMYPWSNVTFSVFHDVPNALLLGGHGEIANNLIYNIKADFDTTVHENAIETISSDSGTSYIHDNVIHDVLIGEPAFLGAAGPSYTPTIYVWNNVFYNLYNDPAFAIEGRHGSSTIYYYNNTVLAGATPNCFQLDATTYPVTLAVVNNHCITTGTNDNFATVVPSSLIESNNLTQAPTAATGQGYTLSEAYAYSPIASGNATVGVGTNLTSSWPGSYSTNDTTYACTQQTISGVVQVVCPARTVNARPSSGAWDAGAYEFISLRPQPPGNLRGLPH
jgi:hypothetical protein